MIGVIGVALSLLVILGGLYLLAKSKKDSLGNIYIFSSYSAIVLGSLLFAGTIIGGACMMRHHSNGQSSCYMSGYGSSCGQSMSCAKGNAHCGSHQMSCMANNQCDYAGGGRHGGVSSHGHHKKSCNKDHDGGKHKMMMHKYQHNDDAEDDDTEVEIEETEG